MNNSPLRHDKGHEFERKLSIKKTKQARITRVDPIRFKHKPQEEYMFAMNCQIINQNKSPTMGCKENNPTVENDPFVESDNTQTPNNNNYGGIPKSQIPG